MRILYPSDPLNIRQPDPFYADAFSAAQNAGFRCLLLSFEALEKGRFNPQPAILPAEPVLYRGWMLNVSDSMPFTQLIAAQGGRAVTTPEHYQRCHHLSGWYDSCCEFTAETHFFADDDRLADHVAALGWDRYFVKAFVKSNNDAEGSIALSPAEVLRRVERIRQYRGAIEGGIAIRRVEAYQEDTEMRYFVAGEQVFSATGAVPEAVQHIAQRIDAPFFSVDIALTNDGALRLVEIGEGQVSDRKSWPLASFISVLETLQLGLS